MARSGGTGRLPARRMRRSVACRVGGDNPVRSPALVLDRAPDVAAAPKQIAQAGDDLADAADEEVPAADGVTLEPAAAHLVLGGRRGDHVEGETGQRGELVVIDRPGGGVEQRQGMRGT